MSEIGLPLPPLDDINRPWFAALHAEELRIQQCSACGRLRHTPRPMCPDCNATQHDWIPMSGRGRIWSFVIAHAPVLPVFEDRVPLPVALVELEEDPRIRVVGDMVPSTDLSRIAIGAEVSAVFTAATDEIGLVRWRLNLNTETSAPIA